jgi:DNA repair exonuclease SbcCD ATPase subunit
MEIKQIKAKNVFRYKDFNLKFDNKVYLVLGKVDGLFDKSNGAGKSSIIDIIFYGLYGETLRGQNDISTDHKGNSEVIVEFDNKKILRGKNVNGNNILSFKEDDKEISGKKKELNNFVTNKINYKLFKLITTLTPKNNFFILNDADKKDLFISLTKNDIIDKIYDKVKEDLDELEKQNYDLLIKEYEKILENKQDIKKEFKEIEEKLCKYLEYENGLLKYNEYKNKINDIRNDIDKYESKYNDLKIKGKKFKVQLENAKEVDLEKVQNEIANYKADKNKWMTKTEEAKEKIEKLGDLDECPLCGSFLKDKEKIKQNYEYQIQDAKEQIKIIDDLLVSAKEKYEELKNQKEEYDELIMNYKETKIKFKEVKENYIILKEKMEKIEKEYEPFIKYKNCEVSLNDIQNLKLKYGEIKQKNVLIEETEEKLENVKKEKQKVQEQIEELKEIKKIFSKDGLKQFVIQKITDFLELRINEMIIRILEDVSIKIILDFTEKCNLMDIQIIRRDEKFNIDELSTGERRILEIVFQIALNDLFELTNDDTINFMAFDESFDALDKFNIEKVNEIIKLLEERNKTIFVVAHNSDVKKYFDNIIVVEKNNNVSTITKESL